MASSWTAGKTPGAANDGYTIATRSPGFDLGGVVNSGRDTLRPARRPPRRPALLDERGETFLALWRRSLSRDRPNGEGARLGGGHVSLVAYEALGGSVLMIRSLAPSTLSDPCIAT